MPMRKGNGWKRLWKLLTNKNMKQLLLVLSMLLPMAVSAQEVEVVDSFVVKAISVYDADSSQVGSEVCEDAIDSANPPVPQVPLEECDSLMAHAKDAHYGVVYKDGKCGIYDLVKRENVTRIEYSHLWYAYRREFEGEYFTYFSLEEPDVIGVVGVVEENNQFMVISMPKKKEEGNE